MSQILSAKPVVEALKEKLRQEVENLKAAGITPTMGLVRVGARTDDVYYEKSIIKNCGNLGIAVKTYQLDEQISQESFIETLEQINTDPEVHGIMVFRPLPEQLDEEVIKYIINPDKDIDCMSPLNLAKVFAGEMDGFVPCTPAAVVETLKYYKIPLQGANIVVVGRSMVVGRPLSMMLLKENATVTICHSKTKDIPELTQKADVVVAAIGKARFIDNRYVNENSVVIDVGINDAGDGTMCGDVDFDAVKDHVHAITPVPGGIGSITTTILLKHVVQACRKLKGAAKTEITVG